MKAMMGEMSELERSTIRTVTRRLIPFLAVLFVVNFLDRTNIGFAALHMSADVGISPSTYGLGAGIFFIGYFLCEVPSNVALYRFGARRWLARIMVSWGIVAVAMAFLQNAWQFLGLRLLLGVAEAGFYPGVIYYLSLWFPARHRARVTALFYLAVPVAQIVGAPLSSWLIAAGDAMGFAGWRVMFLVEGVPALVLGLGVLYWLTDRPADATWLPAPERRWLMSELDSEERLPAQWSQGGYGRQVIAAMHNRDIVALALIYFGITAGSNSLNFFLPSVVQTFRTGSGVRLGLLAAGLLTAIPYAAAAVAMVLWSRHSDEAQERRYHVGGAAMLGAVAIASAYVVNHPLAILCGFTVMAAGVYSAINVFWTVPSRILGGVGAAAGIGMINSIGNLSGFGGTYLTGFIVGKTGSYAPAFLTIAGAVFLGGLGFIVLLGKRGAG